MTFMAECSLPQAFLLHMKELLGEEYPAFEASYGEDRLYGLRVNPLKISPAAFRELTEWELKPIPWAPEGFYYEEGVRPGKHPHYHAGLYYIQEPSAMAPVELLDVQPGHRVLDLCAAPGGKTTQLAGKLQGTGLVAANDIHSERVKALVKNLELNGVREAVVLNEDPAKLQEAFRGYFDRILIDAPCSGEGMFRKEEEMAKAWQEDWTEKYASMQRVLLRQAAVMLKPGGRLVYSTCTFSPEENEQIIAGFLDEHPDFEIAPAPELPGFAPGRPDWVPAGSARAAETAGAARLWPHRLAGEGHFAAALRRREAPEGAAALAAEPAPEARRAARPSAKPQRRAAGGRPAAKAAAAADPREALARFAGESLAGEPYGSAELVLRGEHVYAAPAGLPVLDGIRVVRPGWYLGSAAKGRFAPSHALAMGLRAEEALRRVNFTGGDPRAVRYLKGDTLELTPEELLRAHENVQTKGYTLVCIDGYPAGWAKWQDGLLKNEYPAGWRWT
ncbi:hypothetical protein PM3016_1945 [Paenibacillus mucilaginosus 3016]|uniref:SAM-dependent MTase RsmB/NOP-type domain-containing protein n=3 Tax=Paenibacillus mucilaginosus TaxID=61624 RepID=H6NA05_9BACL|nr:hypothetical protein PM3016_1945 [Paenibacillus mucilaginosus 3016]